MLNWFLTVYKLTPSFAQIQKPADFKPRKNQISNLASFEPRKFSTPQIFNPAKIKFHPPRKFQTPRTLSAQPHSPPSPNLFADTESALWPQLKGLHAHMNPSHCKHTSGQLHALKCKTVKNLPYPV